MPLGMYWVGWQARISERGLKIMFALFGVFGVYLALTAIAEKWQLTSVVFPPYISYVGVQRSSSDEAAARC